MRQRLPIVLSATALAVALFGSTPLGHAVVSAVPAFAKQAAYAKRAGNAAAVNGIKASRQPAPGLLVPLDADGKLPASVLQVAQAGQTGPKGDKGDKGLKGDKGDKGLTGTTGPTGPAGPTGITGYQIVTAPSTTGPLFHGVTITCPAGKKVIGGGGGVNGVNGNGPWLVSSSPSQDGTSWSIASTKSAGSIGIVGYAICANVTP
jgi:hypothetical protein